MQRKLNAKHAKCRTQDSIHTREAEQGREWIIHRPAKMVMDCDRQFIVLFDRHINHRVRTWKCRLNSQFCDHFKIFIHRIGKIASSHHFYVLSVLTITPRAKNLKNQINYTSVIISGLVRLHQRLMSHLNNLQVHIHNIMKGKPGSTR